MDKTHFGALIGYLLFAAIGLEWLALVFAWMVGVVFMILFYGKTLQTKRGAFIALILAAFSPVAVDYFVNLFIGQTYLNKIQYLATPMLAFTFFAGSSAYTSHYAERKAQRRATE